MIDEKELILSVKSGSECSYKALYELWVSRLYRFVYHYVKSETVTDDIVQETFLRIWNNRSKLDPECSFKSYLFTISYRLLLKEIHRQLNNPVMAEFIDYQSELATATDEAERKLEFDLFLVALEKAKKLLPPRQREIFEMNKELNIPILDIAKKLNIGEQVVRNQLSASLKLIRTEMSGYLKFLLVFWVDF
ncbi:MULTISPECIES: RNA polymerase sigma factor [Bacteroidaceae]|jgi:RNA polymerase sigma factor (sigma-70 family)|uniref:RNA polymerase sigma factor n=1 Tax=Bacteroidaceae TaxID=815 RepID=UPI002597B896|nr:MULTISPECIES: sigma-70 family RNA polymerase sigma factor [Bacteroidaceae]